jgi:hypothetical protein
MALVILGACAGGATDGGDGDGDGDFCDLEIEVDSEATEVGSQIFARAFDTGGHFFSPDWSVRFDGASYGFATEAGDSRRISFVPDQPGPYELLVDGTYDGGVGSCTTGRATVNAILPGAIPVDLRLRLTPPPGSGEAPSEQTVRIYGGGDYVLGPLNLDAPQVASGTVAADGAGIATYIEVETLAGIPVASTYSNGVGAYSIALPDETVMVTVSPSDPNLAPLRLDAVTPATLGGIDLSNADTITGQITASGAPVDGARVVLTIDGLPSSVGVTDGSGNYSLAARTGGAAVLEVAPPAATGLPIAELALSDDPADASLIDLDYAALAISEHDIVATEAGGTPSAPGARVLFAVDGLANVAAVTVDGAGQNMATGRVRRFVTAGGGGAINNLMLPDAVYTVLAEPAAGGAGLPSMSTSDSADALVVQLADTPVTWTADLRDGGAGVDGARVIARPTGLVAALSSSSVIATSAAGGAVSLPLIGNAGYEIQIDPPAGLGREHVGAISAPAAGTTDAGAISLVGSITVSGRVQTAGGNGEGSVHLAFYCTACQTPEIPLAEGLTGSSGRFSVELPDPGVSP